MVRQPNMDKSKIRIMLRIVGIGVVTLLTALLVFVVSQPPPSPLSRDNVSLTLVGYTNGNDPKTLLAVFVVTNLSASVILVRQPMVEDVAYDGSNWPRWRAMLESGASTNFTVPVPTNLPSWRLGLYADPDVGAARAIVRVVRAFPFGPPARRHPYAIHSDLIETEKGSSGAAGAGPASGHGGG